VPANNKVRRSRPSSNRGGAAPRKRTQKERSAESARRLLDAAVELIAEKGFDRTTAAEIGERAGYSRSMVRARYGSKDALLRSIFAGELERRLLPPDDGEVTGLPWILARIDHVTSVLEEEPELMRAFGVMSLEAAVAISNLRAWYSQWLEEYERRLVQQLRFGMRTGSIRPDVDPEQEAAQFILTGLGLIFRWRLDPQRYDLAAELARWRSRLEARYST
jgi:AcrR family transcriptional regulator